MSLRHPSAVVSSDLPVFVSDCYCYQISPKSIVSDACASYATLDKLNAAVKPSVDDLVSTTDFFSHYRLNLFNKKCPFWSDENGMCGNIACAVETLDSEEDVPEVWRAAELSKLEGPLAKHPGRTGRKKDNTRPLSGGLGEGVDENCVFEIDDECDERDYCVPEDESATSKGDYVSLVRNPERFTGYAGVGAAQVWDAVYRENCFQRATEDSGASPSSSPSSSSSGSSLHYSPFAPPKDGAAAENFKQVLEAAGRQHALEQMRETHPNAPFVAHTGFEAQDECLEKRVFYRVISGMHASISAHLCWDFLNQTTGEWQPNVACYESRLHAHPDRISNLYFNYALVTRAVAKLGPYLRGPEPYTFCTGDPPEDAATRVKVLAVAEGAASEPHIFDESLMFKEGEGPFLKEDFRNRFRNVSRLMDCVGCDKCRLWGKLQTAGYGTALKVLFEFGDGDDNNNIVDAALTGDVPTLKRTELVALFNTYARISSSLAALKKFRAMVETTGDAAAANGRPVASASIPATSEKDKSKLGKHQSSHVVDVPPGPEEVEPLVEECVGVEGDHDQEAKLDTRTCKAKKRASQTTKQALADTFEKELGLFLKAIKLVLKQWLHAPVMV